MSRFIHSDLGHRSRGDVLEVTLTGAANVRLLDPANFTRYKKQQRHQFHGGLARRSPARIRIPSSGHWHAVVDMQGLRGTTRAGFRVINGHALRPLPTLRQRGIRQQIAEVFENAEVLLQGEIAEYDLFVSHASEDKDAFVPPLAHALRDRGVSVWYDEFALRIGDSLRRKIDLGISRSRFGLVVLSEHFFAKGWPQYELDGLVTMSTSGKQVSLPIWHGVTEAEVMAHSPSLADKVALRTAEYTIDEIADEIAAVVRGA
jgi:hypothetical protein